MAPNEVPSSSHVILAFDGSDHSAAAISLLCELFSAAAQPTPRIFISLLAVSNPLQAGDQDPLRDALRWAHSYLEGKHFQVSSELVHGHPAEKIIEYAEKIKPAFIVLGAKGLRATLGILLGGVAQQVVEYARCPVLVVRAPYSGLHKILLVSDGSQHSLDAIGFLASLPIPASIDIFAVHVLPPLPVHPSPEYFARTYPLAPEVLTAYPNPSTEEEKSWLEEEEAQGKSVLQQAVTRFDSHGIHAAPVLLRGDTATEIMNFVKDNKIDLIVTGSRGLSQVKGWLLGSVSRKLVHYSGCSVLVVRGQSQD